MVRRIPELSISEYASGPTDSFNKVILSCVLKRRTGRRCFHHRSISPLIAFRVRWRTIGDGPAHGRFTNSRFRSAEKHATNIAQMNVRGITARDRSSPQGRNASIRIAGLPSEQETTTQRAFGWRFSRRDYSLTCSRASIRSDTPMDCSLSRLVREVQVAQLRKRSGPRGKTIDVPSSSASMLTPSCVGGKREI